MHDSGDLDKQIADLKARIARTEEQLAAPYRQLEEARETLTRIIDALSYKYRDDARSCYVEGRSWGQIAQQTGCAETAVKNRFKIIVECVRVGLRLLGEETPDAFVAKIRRELAEIKRLKQDQRDLQSELREALEIRRRYSDPDKDPE